MKTEKFSERLRLAIEKKGITAKQLSNACGIDKSTISQYLSGKYVAKNERIARLAQTLECAPEWLEGQDVPMQPTVRPEVCKIEVMSRLSPDGTGESAGRHSTAPEYCDGKHFYLLAAGLKNHKGDPEQLLLCRRQETLLSGQTGIFFDENGDAYMLRYEQREGVTCLSEICTGGRFFINGETEIFRTAARILQILREL